MKSVIANTYTSFHYEQFMLNKPFTWNHSVWLAYLNISISTSIHTGRYRQTIVVVVLV